MSIPYVGMKADEVLKMKGRGQEDAVKAPTPVMGPGGEIMSVTWHYKDVDIRLTHDGLCYRVAEVIHVS